MSQEMLLNFVEKINIKNEDFKWNNLHYLKTNINKINNTSLIKGLYHSFEPKNDIKTKILPVDFSNSFENIYQKYLLDDFDKYINENKKIFLYEINEDTNISFLLESDNFTGEIIIFKINDNVNFSFDLAILNNSAWINKLILFEIGNNSELFIDFNQYKDDKLLCNLSLIFLLGANAKLRKNIFVTDISYFRLVENIYHIGDSSNSLSNMNNIANNNFTDHVYKVHHLSKVSNSDLTYNIVAFDDTSNISKAKILIEKNCPGNEAHLNVNGLMIKNKAKISFKPELEILNDDVVCSHGASIGYVDKMLEYYLCQRGFSQDEALKILCKSFINKNFDFSSNQDLTKIVDNKIDSIF